MSEDTTAPEVTDNVDVPQEVSWQETMGIEGDASFEKFTTPESFTKSYRDMEVYARGAMRIPSDDAGDDQREEFYSKLADVDGVMRTPEGYAPPPEKAEGYEFSDVEGFTGDESVGELKSAALALGMTNAQADGIHNFLASNVVANSKAATESSEAGLTELKGLWGAAFEQKAQAVENTINTLSQKIPGLKDAERSPDFVKLMDLVGEMLGESGNVRQDPRTVMTPMDASKSLNDLYQKYEGVQEGDLGYPAFTARRVELQKLGGRLNFQIDDY
jgi:hypothetical protein